MYPVAPAIATRLLAWESVKGPPQRHTNLAPLSLKPNLVGHLLAKRPENSREVKCGSEAREIRDHARGRPGHLHGVTAVFDDQI